VRPETYESTESHRADRERERLKHVFHRAGAPAHQRSKSGTVKRQSEKDAQEADYVELELARAERGSQTRTKRAPSRDLSHNA
jgi:hypothetical protein